MECPFCDPNIIKEQKFFESENFYCFYNIRPLFPGHSLIIPKKHFKSFLELEDNTAKEFIRVLKKVSKTLMKAYKATGMDLAIQDGKDAGASIDHFHIHLIPRKRGDVGGDATEWFGKVIDDEIKIKTISEEEVKENIDLIKKHLSD